MAVLFEERLGEDVLVMEELEEDFLEMVGIEWTLKFGLPSELTVLVDSPFDAAFVPYELG